MTQKPFLVSTSRLAFLRFARLTRDTFTAAEVRQRLGLDDEEMDDPRSAAVHAAASRTGLWQAALDERSAVELGRAAQCLPLIVFWYRQGVPLDEIGRRVSPFGGAWDADHALDIACDLIAQRLNTEQAALAPSVA